MMRLLQIEATKLFLNRTTRLLIACYFILISLIALIANIKVEIGPIKFQLAEQGIFNFPYIWHFNTYIVGLMKIFFAIIIVAMASSEYSYKTLKQNLIDGLSKKEVLYSKVYTMIAFILASTLFTFIISLILGFSFSDYTELGIVFSEMEYFFAYAVKLFAFFSMCLFLGVWIKRAAFALGFLIVWQMIEGISFGLMKWKLSNIIPSLSAEQVFAFFPLNAMSNLIKEPFTRLSGVQNIANQVGESIDKDYGLDWGSVLIALLWAGIFLALTYRLLQKRDL